jgi:hypothetical protein
LLGLAARQTLDRLGVITDCSIARNGDMLEKSMGLSIEWRSMRVVLIEHGGECVLDGLDARDDRSFGLPKNAHAREDPDELAVIAARRFDESEGRYYWNYQFAPFGPRDRSDGYDVFVCPSEPDNAAQDRLEDFGVVVTECFYAGYVRCLPPAILIDARESDSSDAFHDCCLFPVNVWA